ncbi:uncharacterized protein B0H18DRAFT_874619, partial [Fomitopsis serialis]|uniref:uncharacterized protein n=1 Tax=Fomitopsis serialis TaxID=139415 RepID=UPI002007874B
MSSGPSPSTRKPKSVTVEDVPDEDDGLPQHLWEQHFPGDVASIISQADTEFDNLLAQQKADNAVPWQPFETQEEWQLARWLLTSGLSQAAIDDYLNLEITKHRTKPSFGSKREFFKRIDALPKGPGWILETWEVTGNVLDEDGKPLTEEVELWRRRPVECIKELIGN